MIHTRHDRPDHQNAHHQRCCIAQRHAHNSLPNQHCKSLAGLSPLFEWEQQTTDILLLGSSKLLLCHPPDVSNSLTICLLNAGSGVGHIWLYYTNDWSCHRMEGGLLRPPVACCFCDWSDLTLPPRLFVAPGPSSALQCLPVPGVSQVQPLPLCQPRRWLCAGPQ